jgi:hypothetical protein
MKPRAAFLTVALALGCAMMPPAVMYPGPRRPASEVAVLENAETALEMLDGLELRHAHSQDGVRYEVLPGRHALGVSLYVVAVDPGGGDIERSANVAILCFDAEPGHSYFVGHVGRGPGWRPSITDRASHAVVPFAPC